MIITSYSLLSLWLPWLWPGRRESCWYYWPPSVAEWVSCVSATRPVDKCSLFVFASFSFSIAVIRMIFFYVETFSTKWSFIMFIIYNHPSNSLNVFLRCMSFFLSSFLLHPYSHYLCLWGSCVWAKTTANESLLCPFCSDLLLRFYVDQRWGE